MRSLRSTALSYNDCACRRILDSEFRLLEKYISRQSFLCPAPDDWALEASVKGASAWKGFIIVAKSIAIYPGTFDPMTNGHLDIIERGLKLFDSLVVAIACNGSKSPLFTVEERLEMLREALKGKGNVEVDSFDGLLVDYAAERKADAVLRGLRAVSDFEYEFQMALMNRKLNKNVQTVFLMTGLRWIYISSSIVKEASKFGGDTRNLVPPIVYQRLEERFGRRG